MHIYIPIWVVCVVYLEPRDYSIFLYDISEEDYLSARLHTSDYFPFHKIIVLVDYFRILYRLRDIYIVESYEVWSIRSVFCYEVQASRGSSE